MNNMFLCGECYCIVPATHWFGHRFWHESLIRLGLLGSGFTEAGANEAAAKAAQAIGFEPWQGQML